MIEEREIVKAESKEAVIMIDMQMGFLNPESPLCSITWNIWIYVIKMASRLVR